MPDKHPSSPITSIARLVNRPSPAGIISPLNENPTTVEELVDTEKPASSAAPPDAP